MENNMKNWKWIRLAMALVGVAGMMSACSDDDTQYAADVYFAKPQSPVEVVSASGSVEPGNGASAFDIAFNAAGQWSISAVDETTNSDAEWVRFFTKSGDAGNQLIGIYPMANQTGQERYARIRITCNGSETSFLIVQQASHIVPTVKQENISAKKTITKVEFGYYPNMLQDKSENVYELSYSNGLLAKVKMTQNDFASDNSVNVQEENFETDARMSGQHFGLNKLVYSSSVASDQTYAIVNGKVVAGYFTNNVEIDMTGLDIDFGYSGLNLSTLTSQSMRGEYAWDSGNMKSCNYTNNSGSFSSAFVYGNLANDCNLDINWIIAEQSLSSPNNWLGAMGLIGARSDYLLDSFTVKSNATETVRKIVYTDGVSTANGKVAGLTAVTYNEIGEPWTMYRFYFEE
jgi:hypothetical protein